MFDGDELGAGGPHTSAVVLAPGAARPWTALNGCIGAPEVLGVGLMVGVGVVVGVGVGVGVGLGDGGDGVGDGPLIGGMLADEQADGEEAALTRDEAPGLGALVRPGAGLPDLDPATGAPAPCGLPFALWRPEFAPTPLEAFSRLTKPCRICPRAKTPATTSTTAPATARAGRSQFITGPGDLCAPPAATFLVPFETQAIRPPRTGASRPSPPRRPAAPGAAPAPGFPAGSAATADPALAVLKKALAVLMEASHRTTTSQPSTMNSWRSSHHCRLSHGSLSRARILVKPSPTGSI
jgi:hypothetical protein